MNVEDTTTQRPPEAGEHPADEHPDVFSAAALASLSDLLSDQHI